jgi:hypothetical protein
LRPRRRSGCGRCERSRLAPERHFHDTPQRLRERVPRFVGGFHERDALGEIGIGVHLEHVGVRAGEPDVDPGVIAAAAHLVGPQACLLDLLPRALRDLGGAYRVDAVVDLLQRIPLGLVADDRGVVLGQVREVELHGGHPHVQLPPRDELLHQDGRAELGEHVRQPGLEPGVVVHHRLLVHAGARVLARGFDDQRVV